MRAFTRFPSSVPQKVHMKKKLTKEEFISRVKPNPRYSYDKAIYINSYTNLEIVCSEHGSFWMTPSNRIAGQDCKFCQLENLQEATKISFVEKSIKKFGDLINHSLTEFNGSENKAVLHCKLHGKFEVLPSTHLESKHGCTTCGALAAPKLRAEKKAKTFLQDAFLVHGDTYDYSRMEYKTVKDKIDIVCKVHGSFWQTPQKHLSGQGCPSCAQYGYNTNREGNFYILTNGKVTKVGITHQQVRERVWQINKSKNIEKFKIVSSFFYEDGSIPRLLENACLEYLRSKYQQVSEVFDGSTECFYDVDLNDLLEFVTPLTKPELDNKPANSAQ